MNPLIAISFQLGDLESTYCLRKNYIEFIESAGGTPIIVPPQADPSCLVQIIGKCDGVLIPGGDDIDPALYGEQRTIFRDAPTPLRDAAEPQVIRLCIEQDIPFLGVCRGLQIANVALGGSLCQDVSLLDGSPRDHWQQEPFDASLHEVVPTPGSLLARIAGPKPFGVNSLHHQAVARVASQLRVDAYSDDGVVEALSCPEKRFFLGIQWHPEFAIGSEFSTPIGAAFIEACVDFAHGRMAS